MPVFLQLLKDLTLECLQSRSFVASRALKALSAFLLRVFGTPHSLDKTAFYLKIIQPTVNDMLAMINDNANVEPDLKAEISSTWNSVFGLLKNVHKSQNYHELLRSYEKDIVSTILHADISSVANSIFDLKDSVDEKSRKVRDDFFKFFFTLNDQLVLRLVF